MYEVGEEEFTELQDAVNAAAKASYFNERSQITTKFKDGQCGYAGQNSVVATFHNGVDVRSIADDEDGVPDFDVRATALIATIGD